MHKNFLKNLWTGQPHAFSQNHGKINMVLGRKVYSLTIKSLANTQCLYTQFIYVYKYNAEKIKWNQAHKQLNKINAKI